MSRDAKRPGKILGPAEWRTLRKAHEVIGRRDPSKIRRSAGVVGPAEA